MLQYNLSTRRLSVCHTLVLRQVTLSYATVQLEYMQIVCLSQAGIASGRTQLRYSTTWVHADCLSVTRWYCVKSHSATLQYNLSTRRLSVCHTLVLRQVTLSYATVQLEYTQIVCLSHAGIASSHTQLRYSTTWVHADCLSVTRWYCVRSHSAMLQYNLSTRRLSVCHTLVLRQVTLSYATVQLEYTQIVCLSHAGIASKLMNIGPCTFHHQVARSTLH